LAGVLDSQATAQEIILSESDQNERVFWTYSPEEAEECDPGMLKSLQQYLKNNWIIFFVLFEIRASALVKSVRQLRNGGKYLSKIKTQHSSN
jgi:hypothetical protein